MFSVKINNITFPLDLNTNIFVIKPDGVKRNLESKIEQMLHNSDFIFMKKIIKKLTREEAKKLYSTSFRRDYPLGENDIRAEKHIEYIISGKYIAYLVRHKNIQKPKLFEYCKKIRGENWLPILCNENSIRFVLRDKKYDSYKPIFENGFLLNEVLQNVIHTCLSDIELENAFSIFFNELVLQYKYIDFIQNNNYIKIYKYDLLLIATFSCSSSEKMRIKMHNSLSHLKSFLENNGFSIKILAFADESPKQASKKIIEYNAKIVGFSSVASELRYISEISMEIRNQTSNIMLIGGGPHFTLAPQDILVTNLDAVCVGEGEIPLKMLLNGVDISKIQSWVYRKNDKLIYNKPFNFIDLNNLPSSIHTDWNEYIPQTKFISRRILISRGCPFKCSYCCNYSISKICKGKYVRFRTGLSVEEEIKHIIKEFPWVEDIFLESEIFHYKLGEIDEILKITKKYSNKIYFGTNLRIGVFDKLFLLKLQKNGFKYANIGLESGNENIRKKILNRNYSNQDILDIFNEAKKINFILNTYNLVGLPFENPKLFNETIDLNLRCQPQNAQLSVFFPYPGTDLYYYCLEKGFLKNPFFYQHFKGIERRTPILKMPQFHEDEIIQCYNYFKNIFYSN
jgi:radical SAM superfamily enzyme YgiQ (UPF0313 family)/nucleoside diphosphate kinase